MENCFQLSSFNVFHYLPNHSHHHKWKLSVMNANNVLCIMLNGLHIKYLLVLTKMERICVSTRINLSENNICTSPPLDNSDISKIQICFSLMYSLEFKDIMVAVIQEGLRYLGFTYFVVSLSACPRPCHSLNLATLTLGILSAFLLVARRKGWKKIGSWEYTGGVLRKLSRSYLTIFFLAIFWSRS